MTDSNTNKITTTAAHDFDGISAECELMDLSTATEMLLSRLDDVCKAIINETDVFEEWEQAHWIALRMKKDVQRILGKMTTEANERDEARKAMA